MLRIREYGINTAKSFFANEVKKHCSRWFYNDLNVGHQSIVQQGNSYTIFNHFSKKYDDDWKTFMKVTPTIFLYPVLLHKLRISLLKNQVESKYRIAIVKIELFDTPRCAYFEPMISHKNIKNMVEKWYSTCLTKFVEVRP